MSKQEEFKTLLERAYCSLDDAYDYLCDALRLQAACPSDFNELYDVKVEIIKLRMEINTAIRKIVLEEG